MIANAERPSYWAVIWGDQREQDDDGDDVFDITKPNFEHPPRVTSEKTDDPVKACRLCYGCAGENMWLKNLGTTVDVLRSDKRRIAALTSEEGWMRLGKNPKTKSGIYL
jgi:hypothetical protein